MPVASFGKKYVFLRHDFAVLAEFFHCSGVGRSIRGKLVFHAVHLWHNCGRVGGVALNQLAPGTKVGPITSSSR